MTLISTSASTSSIDQSGSQLSYEEAATEDDQSKSFDDDVSAIPQNVHAFQYDDAIIQCLGHPGTDVLPSIGKVSIENSSDVHFGDKNIYQGPVTIKQIVYANGSASLVPNGDTGKGNLGFTGDSDGPTDELKASEFKSSFTDPSVLHVDRAGNLGVEHSFRKGYIWLQTACKSKPLEIGILIAITVLFAVVLAIVMIWQLSTGGTAMRRTDSIVNNEPDIIKPIDYDPDLAASSHIILRMISRYQWLAQPPANETTPLVTPVPYVIIHHTATENCSSQAQCVFYVRNIQTFHIESRGWYDIGYNFLVGGDGSVYEGRGWEVEGAHTFGWNDKSIGIAFIGTFINYAPPGYQILASKRLIDLGIEQGFIKRDYKLIGARQLFGTESPGTALFEKIKKWPHWIKEP